jgi:hypothetical protein
MKKNNYYLTDGVYRHGEKRRERAQAFVMLYY